jgi:hypothetical protein
VALLAALGGTTALTMATNAPTKDSAKVVSSQTSKPAADVAGAASTTVTYQGQDGKTALELLKQKATVVTKDSSYGPYVDSVNGVKGGEGGKYWTFYINGKMAQVGGNAYDTKGGDKIEWKFE